MKPCPSGTTPSNLNCEVVFERRLSIVVRLSEAAKAAASCRSPKCYMRAATRAAM
jgi:hypothetical protein